MEVLLKFLWAVSIAIVLLGVVLILLSNLLGSAMPDGIRGTLRDFGIALCSTGLISTAYEFLIRAQLLSDTEERIKKVVDTDAARLGILQIFRGDGERTRKEFDLDALLKKAGSEVIVYDPAPLQLLTNFHSRLVDFVSHGGTLHLLVAKMDGQNLKALDDTFSLQSGMVRDNVVACSRRLRMLRDDVSNCGAGDRLIIRCHDTVPTFSAIGIDLSATNGIFVVELNGMHLGDGDRPSFQLEPRTGGLYDYYFQQLTARWNLASAWAAPSRDEAPRTEAAVLTTAPFADQSIIAGLQHELYTRARALCAVRNIHRVVFYHYSGAIAYDDITALLARDVTVDLYIQSPGAANDLGLNQQAARISSTLQLLRRLDQRQRSRLTVWQTRAPITVRAAVFQDEFIILGWYVYTLLHQSDGMTSAPKTDVHGRASFGVLIDRVHPGYSEANEFLAQYQVGLDADQLTI